MVAIVILETGRDCQANPIQIPNSEWSEYPRILGDRKGFAPVYSQESTPNETSVFTATERTHPIGFWPIFESQAYETPTLPSKVS